jgi:thioredoxin-like negative regulator of GroEL
MSMKPTIEITESNFENEVLKSNQPVLVEFATGWSLPSMMMDGALEEIADEFVDLLKVARVNRRAALISIQSVRAEVLPAGPIVNTDLVRGNPIKVREFYGFGPLDDMR